MREKIGGVLVGCVLCAAVLSARAQVSGGDEALNAPLPASTYENAALSDVLRAIAGQVGIDAGRVLSNLPHPVTISWPEGTTARQALELISAQTQMGFVVDGGMIAALPQEVFQAVEASAKTLPNGLAVENADVNTVLRMIADQAGVDIETQGQVAGNVSLQLGPGAPVREALDLIAQQLGLRVSPGEGGGFLVAPHGQPEEQPVPGAPVDPLDRGITGALRLMNVSMSEAAAQLEAVCDYKIRVCPELQQTLRMSSAQGTPLRAVLDKIALAARAQWSLDEAGMIQICVKPVVSGGLRRPALDQGAALRLAEERLHVVGRELFYRGRPVKLIGCSYEPAVCDADFDAREWLDLLTLHGVNLTRVFLVSSWRLGIAPFVAAGGVYDLSAFNEAYFKRLEEFVRLAEQRGIIVQLCLMEASQLVEGPHHERRATSPWVRGLNVQKVDGTYAAESPLFQPAGQAADLVGALARRAVQATAHMGNVIYEVCNLPPAGSEDWILWLAGVVNKTLEQADNPAPVSVHFAAGLDKRVLNSADIDMYSVQINAPSSPPGVSDKPCILSTHGAEIGGDIGELIDAACAAPAGHFEYREHLLLRYWEKPAGEPKFSLVLPREPDATPAGRLLERLRRFKERAAEYATNPIYPARAVAARDAEGGAGRLAYYGALGVNADQLLKVGERFTLCAVDLTFLDLRQAVRAVVYLYSKNTLAVLAGEGETGLRSARDVLDQLWREGRRDAIANVWAVLLAESDYTTGADTVPLYGNDPVRLQHQALIARFHYLICDVETPWGEKPYAHIKSMMIFGPSQDDRPAWGPWEVGDKGQPIVHAPMRMLPARLDVLGLRLPAAWAGDDEQGRRLDIAVRANYPGTLREGEPPDYPNGAPPVLILVGDVTGGDAQSSDVLGAQQRALLDQAEAGPYAGLLWWRYDRLPSELREALVEEHRQFGAKIRPAAGNGR